MLLPQAREERAGRLGVRERFNKVLDVFYHVVVADEEGATLMQAFRAILIGIACSLILIVAMKVAALLQRVLWSNLPAQLGVSADSPLWIIAMLTATGIAVGLVIRYSPAAIT